MIPVSLYKVNGKWPKSLWSLLCCFVVSFIFTPSESVAQPYAYPSPTPGHLPIVAQYPVPYGVGTEKDEIVEFVVSPSSYQSIFEDIRNSGFNTIIFDGTFRAMTEVLDICNDKEIGLKTILSHWYLYDSSADKKNLKRLWDWYERQTWKDNVAGFCVYDEPAASVWNSDKSALYSDYNWVRDRAGDKLVYFNLCGTNGEPYCVKGKGFGGMLEGVEQIYYPELFTYDFYPYYTWVNADWGTPDENTFDVKGSGNPLKAFYDYMFEFLADASRISRSTGKPFWTYCLALPHKIINADGSLFKYFPIPTAGMLRVEAFTALAFGSQGIVYWRLGQSRTRDFYYNADGTIKKPGERFFYSGPAAIEKSRAKSGNYDWTVKTTGLSQTIKQVNMEIRRFENVFLNCQLKDYCHIGKTYAGQKLSQGNIDCLSGIVMDGREGAVVTSLKNGEKNYVVVVSQDAFNSHRLNLMFKNGYAGKIYMADKTSTFNTAGKGGTNKNFRVQPGGVVIIEWERI